MLASLFALTALLSIVSAQCPKINTRYECRELPDATRQSIFTAIKAMMDKGAYTKYVDQHVAVTSTAHGVPEFLPWHRHYLHTFEQEVGQTMCYWDWATDAQAPEYSMINAPGWCGTDGKGSCVTDGFFGTYKYQGSCSTTQWDGGSGKIGALYSIDYVAKLVSENTSYDNFRVAYEGTAHARVHNGIGAMFSQMQSVTDPLFFFHHGNVDRHYAIWQWANPSHAQDYPKPTSTQLPNFPGITVASQFNTQASPYCYTYSNMDIISHGRSTAGLDRRGLLTLPAPPRLARRSDGDGSSIQCGTTDEATGQHYPPCGDDRHNLVDLRDVKPTPDAWLKMEGLNITTIRDIEDDHRQYIHSLNKLPGYVSPSALYNRPALLSEAVKRGGTGFYVYDSNGKKTTLPCPQKYKNHPEKAVKYLRKHAEKHYPVQDYDDVHGKLKDVVGAQLANNLVKAGKKHANKPYTAVEDEAEYCEPEGDYGDDNASSYGKKPHHRHHHHHKKHYND
jgi:tyrosinase